MVLVRLTVSLVLSLASGPGRGSSSGQSQCPVPAASVTGLRGHVTQHSLSRSFSGIRLWLSEERNLFPLKMGRCDNMSEAWSSSNLQAWVKPSCHRRE